MGLPCAQPLPCQKPPSRSLPCVAPAAEAPHGAPSPQDTSPPPLNPPLCSCRYPLRYIHNLLKYEFDFEFETPVTYPVTAPEIAIPSLDGKTAKMYRGGKICLTVHFKPLWAKNVPRFGIAHAMCLGLAPWLAAEVPHLVEAGIVQPKA
uniref:Ubiquitin-fold modifier-conjugating enzyme 1 n=1 Tax=Tetraselmis sp. GSL018 TaxID=582737 RepID=A0A061S488_9CHLO